MISTEEKQKYLLGKWRYVEIARDFETIPAFDLDGRQISGMVENVPIDSFCCRNYFLDWDNVDKCYLMKDENGDPFWSEVKEFYGLSVEEVIDLAYKSERIGEQLNLFVEILGKEL
ncbi:MAG: hypothetical protein KAW92_03695 [Candidatus Cloacimonetes bacterium]|nr:hypothetical protein [Candidatus Cloacimonadota bacterium]